MLKPLSIINSNEERGFFMIYLYSRLIIKKLFLYDKYNLVSSSNSKDCYLTFYISYKRTEYSQNGYCPYLVGYIKISCFIAIREI